MTYVKLHTEFTPQIRENIIFKVINKKKHEELLENIPYIDYLDLAIIFYCYLPEEGNEDSKSFAQIDNSLLEQWNVDVGVLMDAAIENTPRILGLKIRGIFSTIASYIGDEELSEMAELEDSHTPLYVATNNDAVNGAGVLIYKDALKMFAEKIKADLYIIPCSIHEIIIAKAIEGCDMNLDGLKEMIYQVNRTELSPQDYLSDNLYFYNRKEGVLGII